MERKITVVISAYNEKKNIKDCIDSALLLTENIIVVDTGSTDQTASLVKNSGFKVVSFPYVAYVEPSRKFAINLVKTDWLFILDADERITKALAEEIKKAIARCDKTHFQLPRKNIFSGKKWLQHGGWYPDYQIRLIKKNAFRNWPSIIHSTPIIKGEGGILKNPLLHYFHPNLSNMVDKTIVFEDIESDLLFKAGKKVSVATLFRKFFGELYRRLIKNKGFLDGSAGVIESIYQAYSKTVTYIYLYEKYQKSRSV